MQSGDGAATTPQFETAEYQAKPGKDDCFVCKQTISGKYFRVNSRMACAACTERLKASIPKDSHAAFVRATTFGAGAAIAGLVLYSLVGIATGLVIGYVSLAVGWLVGTAMMKGSAGLGGRRYQLVAVLFTYAAVSMAAIPMAIAESVKTKKAERSIEESSASGQANQQTPGQTGTEARSSEDPSASNAAPHSVARAVGYLALIGLASPFLELTSDPFHGMIGLVILLVGIRIAWQKTRGRPPIVIDGPF